MRTHLQIPWSSLPAFIKGQTWQTVGRGLYLEGDTTGVGSYEDDILVMFPDILSLVTNITVTVLQVQYAVILVYWRFPQTQHPGSPSSTGQSHLTSCILQECQQSSASPLLPSWLPSVRRCLNLTLLVWMTVVSLTVLARSRSRRRREAAGQIITREGSAGTAGSTDWRKLKSIFWFRSGQLKSALQTFYNNSIVGL